MRAVRLGAPLAAVLAVACGGGAPRNPPAPYTPPPVSAPPSNVLLAPNRVAGQWRLRTNVERQGRGQRGRGQGPERPLRLEAAPVAAPDPAIASAAQFGATVRVDGYTRAPRGRPGQAGAWYPIPGDSIVIQFSSAAQRGAQVQLRGQVQGAVIRGDVWFVTESGATFQLGTFSATRQGR